MNQIQQISKSRVAAMETLKAKAVGPEAVKEAADMAELVQVAELISFSGCRGNELEY